MLQDLKFTVQREWLETNGLGGWAGSTISGMNSRRYHGLLVAALNPPVERVVLLSKLDETIYTNDETLELATNQYPGVIHPTGYRYLNKFKKEYFPEFEYEFKNFKLKKTITAVNGENTMLIIYEVPISSESFSLELKPFIAFRDFHGLSHANKDIQSDSRFEDGIFCIKPYDGLPEMYISIPGASFEENPQWYYHFEYTTELERGLDYREDLFSHGRFLWNATPGSRLGIIVSLTNPAGRDVYSIYKKEKFRRQNLIKRLPADDHMGKTLTLAADQFVVRRGKNLRSIIAGYHWFADWGRDTMIALPGITLITGRFSEAKKILSTFAKYVNQGMLPNHFPDTDEEPEYNTVDASLWFFVAIYKYIQYTGDNSFVKDNLMPVLKEIIEWHYRGTRFNIKVNSNGLLYAGTPDVQLTWMDAKIGDWVITPRSGYAVEINALWYNALSIYAYLAQKFDQEKIGAEFEKRALSVKKEFNRKFWYSDKGYLYDYIDESSENKDIRPNQLFALSLPFSPLSKTRQQSVLKVVEKNLLTPKGLRSLAKDHPQYRPSYGGDVLSRDSAYHQGTVWSWLLGPYITALVKVRAEKGRTQARKIFNTISTQFYNAGIGTISEIFDAEKPYADRGCIAQAWSVAELLRAYREDLNNEDKNRQI
jgi:predicted glycogen debranching enzyme